MIPDVLVMLIIAVFGVSVGQRVHHIASRHNRHLWRLLYEKTGLVLDLTILILQAFSKTPSLSLTCTYVLSCCLEKQPFQKDDLSCLKPDCHLGSCLIFAWLHPAVT